MSKKEYNPFEGMDETTTPDQLLQALMSKAIENNDLRPIGGVIGMMQKQVEATIQQLGGVMQQLRSEVGQVSMMTDVSRLTMALIINILVDNNVITKEKFDELYKEKVTDVMDKHIKDLEEKRKQMAEEEKKRIEEFAKKAAENLDAIIDPNTGEIVSEINPEDVETPQIEVEEIVTPAVIDMEKEVPLNAPEDNIDDDTTLTLVENEEK